MLQYVNYRNTESNLTAINDSVAAIKATIKATKPSRDTQRSTKTGAFHPFTLRGSVVILYLWELFLLNQYR